MESFENRIRSLKSISYSEIEHYYTKIFACSIISMLLKGGYKPFEYFSLRDHKKRKSRLNPHHNTLAITYCSSMPDEWDSFEVYGEHYTLQIKYPYPNSGLMYGGVELNENVAQISRLGDPKELEEVYNYMRLEFKKGSKNFQAFKEDQGFFKQL